MFLRRKKIVCVIIIFFLMNYSFNIKEYSIVVQTKAEVLNDCLSAYLVKYISSGEEEKAVWLRTLLKQLHTPKGWNEMLLYC